jgi:hypothetical protein
MKHRDSLLPLPAEMPRIFDRLLAISLMLYAALLVLTFFVAVFLWGGTVKAAVPKAEAPNPTFTRACDFRHYSPLTSLQIMSPSYRSRYASTNPRGIEQ